MYRRLRCHADHRIPAFPQRDFPLRAKLCGSLSWQSPVALLNRDVPCNLSFIFSKNVLTSLHIVEHPVFHSFDVSHILLDAAL